MVCFAEESKIIDSVTDIGPVLVIDGDSVTVGRTLDTLDLFFVLKETLANLTVCLFLLINCFLTLALNVE